MKKNQASRLTIKRTSTSPYFSSTFNHLEKESLAPFVDMLPSETTDPTSIIITNTHTNFDLLSSQQIDALELIIHPNSGYDNIPLDFIKGSKAPIVIGSTIRAQAVAQYIMSAILNHFSAIPDNKEWDKARKWPRKLLSDLKVTLIGFGHIGKILNAFLAPIVKTINVYDPYENLSKLEHKDSDIVILACGLNSKSRYIIDKNFLNVISDKALIVNAARGELIKTSDLVNFLSANEEAFAVLDVFEKEPNDFSEFKSLKNIKLSSHIAGVFKDIDFHTIDFEVKVVKDFLELTEFDFKNKYQKMILQNRLRNDVGII
jgi:D-3-phosphoglycerate dehydrogenase